MLVLLVRGRSTSLRGFIRLVATALVAVPLTTMATAVTFNGVADSAPVSLHDCRVERTWADRATKSPSYCVQLNGWDLQHRYLQLEVTKNAFTAVGRSGHKGQRVVRIGGHPGAMGCEWWSWLTQLNRSPGLSGALKRSWGGRSSLR